jgi:GNAT superfamily N-acetyltransferase
MALISTSSDIEIMSLLPEHRQSVINLLMSSFFIQEPLNAMLKFDIPHEVLSWADYLVDVSLRDQCSFIAIDNTSLYKDVIAVILNGISNRNDSEQPIEVTSEKLKFIFTLLDKTANGYNLFDFFQTDRVFHYDIINIEENHRRQNLSAQLITASEDKAREMGIKGASVICSSLYSKRAFERQGFQVLHEILYSEHGDGRLTDMGEHDRSSLLVKQL